MKKDVELKSPPYEGGDLGEVGNIVKASNPLLISLYIRGRNLISVFIKN
jgi:hypothetical protein